MLGIPRVPYDVAVDGLQSGITEGLFFPLMLPWFVIVFAVSIVSYIVQAFALYRIVNQRGLSYAYIAWIPVVNVLLLPLLVEDDVRSVMKGRFTLVFGLSVAVSLLVRSYMPTFLSLLLLVSIIPVVLMYYAFYHVAGHYSRYRSIHTLVAVLLGGVSVPFQLFMFAYMSGKKPDVFIPGASFIFDDGLSVKNKGRHTVQDVVAEQRDVSVETDSSGDGQVSSNTNDSNNDNM